MIAKMKSRTRIRARFDLVEHSPFLQLFELVSVSSQSDPLIVGSELLHIIFITEDPSTHSDSRQLDIPFESDQPISTKKH